MPVTTRIKKLMAAISPRKKVECTGKALRPYFCWRALSCRRSSSHPVFSSGTESVSVGSVFPVDGEVHCVSSIGGCLLWADWSIEQTVSDHGAVRAIGDGHAWQGAIGRPAADCRVIGRVVDAAVARTQDQTIPVQLLVDRAAEMCADRAEGGQARHPITWSDANDHEQVVLIRVLADREELR